jgi:hypothetical protein
MEEYWRKKRGIQETKKVFTSKVPGAAIDEEPEDAAADEEPAATTDGCFGKFGRCCEFTVRRLNEVDGRMDAGVLGAVELEQEPSVEVFLAERWNDEGKEMRCARVGF